MNKFEKIKLIRWNRDVRFRYVR